MESTARVDLFACQSVDKKRPKCMGELQDGTCGMVAPSPQLATEKVGEKHGQAGGCRNKLIDYFGRHFPNLFLVVIRLPGGLNHLVKCCWHIRGSDRLARHCLV